MKDLWILTEERPKKEVIITIIKKFATDQNLDEPLINRLKILPIFENDRFTFRYRVEGISCQNVNEIYMEIISGFSSFVDFLIFYQNERPSNSHQPIYAIEETKTDDSESRNTGVYQRCAKFVFINYFYPAAKKIMLYNLKVEQKINPTDTSIFGTRLLMNLDVEILGKELDSNLFKPFGTLEEMIKFKDNMRRPPKGNVPILIEKKNNLICISGRLIKSGSLSHDPNIGALALISQGIRNLGWTGEIVIMQHGLEQRHIGKKNKFIQIANQIGIRLEGLTVPTTQLPTNYWKYERASEKLATIFIHLVVEEFTQAHAIFENHAGCERSYFQKKGGFGTEYKVLEKYEDREAYKAGNRSKRLHLPDLIFFDNQRNEVINIEGKKFEKRKDGIKQLENYDTIERDYIQSNYSGCNIIRTVVVYGSHHTRILEPQIGFLLNKNGELVVGQKSPKLFIEAINSLSTSKTKEKLSRYQ